MLVLSRKIGEGITIGGNISVFVQRINGNRVTLGIEAPSDVRVLRGELTDQVIPVSEESILLDEFGEKIPVAAIYSD